MSPELLDALAIFVLAILVGFEVISKVPATLHTPLMSGANSIHGIVLVGAMLIAATADDWLATCWPSWPWSSAPPTSSAATWSPTGCCRCSARSRAAAKPTEGELMSRERALHLRLLRLAGRRRRFVLGLHLMNSPATARRQPALGRRHDAGRLVTTLVWLATAAGRADRRRPSPSSSSASPSAAASASTWRAP